MNLKKFIISSDAQISFVLKKGTEEVLSQRYDPDSQGRIEIDMRDVVHAQLAFELRGSAVRTYEQTNLHAEFTAEIDGQAVNFHAVRGGVDNLADTATNFLTQNWLTWQPTVKPVTYYTPEFLTYYAPVAGVAKLRGYFVGDDGQVTSQKDIELCNVEAGKAYTIPVEYQVVVSLLYPDGKPGYYDVWVENASGERLTYIQRYYADAMRSISEDWVLFENSLGGVDCFRAYGKTNLEADHTHNLAEVDEVSEEYRVDTERKYEKNTGHLSKDEARWLLDFFPSQKKYIYVGSYLRQIVVVESNVTGNLRELPTNYTFTYKYADARPLLNLPRTDVPADMLDITIPEVGNFTIPPRLAEVPRLPLSEGDLFPVQNPYSETWSTTTVGAIAEVIGQLLAAAAGAGGGVGHTHKNIDLLNLLSYVEEYLLVNGKKIKAGYADTAGSVAEGKYIRKDQEDQTKFLVSFLAGAVFGEHGFAPGLTGFGAHIDGRGYGEMRGLTLWEWLMVPEIRYNRVEIIIGDKWRSPGGGIIETCTPDTDEEGKPLNTGTCTLKLEDGEYGAVEVGDMCMGIFHFGDDRDAAENSDDGKGNFTYAGFATAYWLIKEVSGDNNGTFRYSLRDGYNIHPCPQMHFSCRGNVDREDRQTSVYETRTYTRMLWKQNTWEISKGNIAMQYGDLSNLKIFGLDMTGYSMYLNSVYFTGTIMQVKPDGTPIRTANDRGAWPPADNHADYFDRFSYNGCIWLCVAESGTDTPPSTDSAAWLKQVDRGDDGASMTNMGGWYSGLLVPNLGIVRMYDASWMTTVKDGTKNPPMWCWTDKDGNRFTFSDGGYVLTGEENTSEYKLVARDGQKGADGVGIKGEDGKTLYTWIRYADDEKGNGISDNPTGKNYIGIANNKETPLESNNPADYTWSNIKGEPGIGIPGDDGKTLYTWIAYSDNADGSGMYQAPKDTTKYIGIAPNKETATESNDPADYVWSKFRGEDGRGITKIENFYLATSLSSGVTSSTPGWTTSVQAVSATNRYLWNYEKITYTDTMTTSTQPAILGQYSADGKGIASIQEEYGVSASQSAKPSSWQSSIPSIDSTNKYLWNRETTTYTDGSTRTTEHVIAVYGDQGDSVTNLGQWHTGLLVPYLGIVRMGVSSWMGSTKSGTNNPPLWCWTDKDGNRLTFSDGGYALTGGENTSEYQLVATDGKNGEDGESIKGEDGLSGCTIRRAVWKAGVEWRNDADKATQPRYEDTALIKDDAVSTGWRAYQCLVTHTSSEANKPGTSGGSSYWREYSLNTPDFFTNFILANGASIDLMQSNQVVVYTPEYVAEAGLTGKGIGSNADVRIFGGPISGNEAPFMVMSNGSLVATKATITGKIYATEGWFRGNIETAESGKRIVISPTDNSIRMIDASNKELLKMWFSNLDGESYDSSRILMDKYIGGAKNAGTDIMPGNISLVSIAGNMLTTLTSGGIILTNTANGNSITLQPEKTILFTSSGSYNGRTAYFNVSGIGGLRFINGLLVE